MSLNVLEDLKEVYKLIYKLLIFPESDWKTKIYASTAMAYLINPYDVIPEAEKGSEGYIDDLYLVVSILGEISLSLDRDLIEENWKEDENILSIIERVHQKTQDILGDVCEDILGMVGLRKYISMEYENLGLNHSSKIRKLMDEKIELVGLLSFITAKLYGSSRSRSLDNLREFLQKHEDYPEIERIIQIARDKSISETINKLPKDALSIERKMRRKRIMKLAGE